MIGYRVVFENIGKAALTTFDVQQPRAGEVLVENEFTVVSAGAERANSIYYRN